MKSNTLPPRGLNLPGYSAQLVSPDGSRFAYLGPEMDPEGRLYVIEADGKAREAPNWATGEFWQLIGWLDGASLALRRYTDVDGAIHQYDLVNGDMALIEPAFPNTSRNGDLSITDIGAHSPFPIYDPRLSRVLVERAGPADRPWGAFELWDVEAGKLLWQLSGFWGHRPVWSPDGSRFAISSAIDVSPESTDWTRTLTVFDRDGTELSRIEQSDGPVAWSHDGKWIAGYRALRASCDESCPIGLLLHSAATGETVIYSIATGGVGALGQYPVWNPDSTMLAFNAAILDESTYYAAPAEIVVLDLVDEVAWRIPGTAKVLGWLDGCP